MYVCMKGKFICCHTADIKCNPLLWGVLSIHCEVICLNLIILYNIHDQGSGWVKEAVGLNPNITNGYGI